MIYTNLINKEAKLALVGLGYVGLPIALEFAKRVKVVGFDINQARVDMMRRGEDPSRELEASDFENRDITFTADINELKDVNFFIVAVPTPIDETNLPDLKPLQGASRTVGKVLKKGDYVVFESTVYPGCTEEDCIPILEAESGLKFPEDFKVGYSPERINPGDKEHTLQNVIKIVSGCDEESLDEIAKTYELVVAAGVHRATSIKVAEAAKIVENTQRDVNIALLNELSHVYQQLGIAPAEIWDAASTKWNFLPFRPGLAGGHCISVDPYYLLNKAAVHGISSPLVSLSREINEQMVERVFNQIKDHLLACNKSMATSSILIMGISFKPNVVDTRNAKAIELAMRCSEQGLNVEVYDPVVAPKKSTAVAQLSLIDTPVKKYDIILMAVGHQVFKELEEDYFCNHIAPDGLMIDLSGYFRTIIKRINYLSI